MRLYLFDLDGTLTDTLRAIAYFGNMALCTHGFPAIAIQRYRALVGDGMDILIHRMLAEFDADTQKNFLQVRKTYDAAYSRDFLHDTKEYDGITDALDKLRQNGAGLAVLSNKPHHVVVPIVESVFGAGYFDMVCGQKEGMKKKPDPDSALHIARKLGCVPENCTFIGDTNVDILTGRNAGMRTAGVLWGFRGRHELEEAGADVILEHPCQIAEL